MFFRVVEFYNPSPILVQLKKGTCIVPEFRGYVYTSCDRKFRFVSFSSYFVRTFASYKKFDRRKVVSRFRSPEKAAFHICLFGIPGYFVCLPDLVPDYNSISWFFTLLKWLRKGFFPATPSARSKWSIFGTEKARIIVVLRKLECMQVRAGKELLL